MVTIRTLLKRGYNHDTNCEDAFCVEKHHSYILFAVFDGCSTGKKSHFASELMAKLFRNVVNKLDYMMYITELHTSIIEELHSQLRLFHINYRVPIDELLSTIIFGIIDTRTNAGIITFMGDGVMVCNGEILNVDQDNTPNYLAYHLNDSVETSNDLYNFEKDHCKIEYITNIKDISICTDGILSYQYSDKSFTDELITDAVITEYCKDKNLLQSEVMLGRKHNILNSKEFKHYDDIAIVRIIIDNEETEIK